MYTKMYMIFCRFCGIIWHCIMSILGMMWANVLKSRDFGFSWNHSVSMVLVPLSPLATLKISEVTNKYPKKYPKTDF